jgi:hypothetical protein
MSTWSEQRIAEMTIGKPWGQLTEMEQESIRALLRVTDTAIVYRILDRVKKAVMENKEMVMNNTILEMRKGKKINLLDLQNQL